MTTYSDLIEHALLYLGSDPGGANSDKARAAVVAAYRNLAANFHWSYYRTIGRITTYAAQQTGTVQYVHTGGVVERALTLTGATWPAWAGTGTVSIANVAYDVLARLSGTLLQLKATTNPGVDVPALTPYTLWLDAYPLPDGVFKVGSMFTGTLGDMRYVSPAEIVNMRRRGDTLGTPRHYSVIGTGSKGGVQAKFWPPPDNVYPIDFIAQRMPRPLLISRREQGLAGVTTGLATVVGASTMFTPDMVGSTFRYAGDSARAVTGQTGQNPYYQEATIISVESPTGLTLDAAALLTSAKTTYVVTDPADIDETVAGRLVLREVEQQCRIITRMESTRLEVRYYSDALQDARAADSRSLQPKVAGGQSNAPFRLSYFPSGTEFTGG